ncbi:hypothetical protein ACU4GR_26085 [Methylobacterium oryzae CBMB20]
MPEASWVIQPIDVPASDAEADSRARSDSHSRSKAGSAAGFGVVSTGATTGVSTGAVAVTGIAKRVRGVTLPAQTEHAGLSDILIGAHGHTEPSTNGEG